MQSFISLEEFAKSTSKTIEEIESLCKENKLNCKEENGEKLVEVSAKNPVLIDTSIDMSTNTAQVIEKTIAVVLNLHEKVLDAKEETISALKDENQFLKDSLYSMQELYEEDRKTIESLQKQLTICQEELEFMRRKYKLMWGKVTEKFS